MQPVLVSGVNRCHINNFREFPVISGNILFASFPVDNGEKDRLIEGYFCLASRVKRNYRFSVNVIVIFLPIDAILYHADISKRYFSVCHLKIVFYFLHELKQRSRSSDVTGRHYRPVDSDVTEGVITSRSNRMKFRLSASLV